MNSLPYMQFYVNDYLADTAHLNATQHGAYVLLLMNYWQRGKPLDNTNNRLAAVARLTPEEWEDNREILAEFFWIDGDIWTHARVENDLAKVREKSEKASVSARQAFAKRSQSVRIADGDLSHIYTDTDTNTDTKNIYTDEFEIFWNTYPVKIGKGTAFKAWVKALKKATLEVIIEGADRYAKDPNREGEFTAHPATWLNGERWLDQPLPPKRPKDGFRAAINVPTIVPPRYSADEQPKGVPAPKNIRDIVRSMSDKS
jgi:uncharacterized protein YdaU (DUF1376 family)